MKTLHPPNQYYLYARMDIWKRHDCEVKPFSSIMCFKFMKKRAVKLKDSRLPLPTSLHNCKLPFIVKTKIHRTKIRKKIAILYTLKQYECTCLQIFFFLITFEKKFLVADSLFRKIDSRKFKIYTHMVQINLFISLRSKNNSFRGK